MHQLFALSKTISLCFNLSLSLFQLFFFFVQVHPYRYFSAGRATLGNRSSAPAENCILHSQRRTCQNAHGNSGWAQGAMNAALLGLTDVVMPMVVGRAKTGPAKGYRFQGFAPHEQDYEPSADHFANMNSALNWMLLMPADDGQGACMRTRARVGPVAKLF